MGHALAAGQWRAAHLLTSQGKLRLPDADASDLQLSLAHARVQVPLCAELTHTYASDDDGNSYDMGYSSSVVPLKSCGGDARVPINLDLPAGQTTIREKKIPQRGFAGLALAVDALYMAAFGLPFTLAGLSWEKSDPTSGGGQAFVAIGVGTFVIGGLVALGLLPTLLAPESDRTIYPPDGKPGSTIPQT